MKKQRIQARIRNPNSGMLSPPVFSMPFVIWRTTFEKYSASGKIALFEQFSGLANISSVAR